MDFKPGDILYRKYSDQNDLYIIISIKAPAFGPTFDMATMLPYYRNNANRDNFYRETVDSLTEWFIKVDLNNYKIKDKFLNQIEKYLEEHLQKNITYDEVLDNLTYVEI